MPKPAVFIPGLPGSHLLDESGRRVFLVIPDSFRAPLKERLKGPNDLALDDGVRAGAPVATLDFESPLGRLLAFFIDTKRAQSLYDILRPLYRPDPLMDWLTPFGWDWRRPVWDPITQEALHAAILELSRRRRRKVVMIVHSTGGLVLRHLLEEHPRRDEVLDRIDRIIAFGVPWAGLLKTFESLTGQRGLGAFLSKPEAQRILGHSWSAFDLLPPVPRSQSPQYPQLVVRVDGGRRHISPLNEPSWLPAPSDLRDQMERRAAATVANLGSRGPVLDLGQGHDIGVTNVVGWGFETTVLAELRRTAAGADVEFITDPQRAGLGPGDDGDGTVARRSAAWLQGPNLVTFHLPIGHGSKPSSDKHITLWSNEGGRNLLRHFIGGEPLEPFVYAAVDREDVGSGDKVRVRFAANAPDGSLLDDATVHFHDPRRTDARFEPGSKGRLMVTFNRADLRQIGAKRRIELEVRWREGGARRTTGRLRRLVTA